MKQLRQQFVCPTVILQIDFYQTRELTSLMRLGRKCAFVLTRHLQILKNQSSNYQKSEKKRMLLFKVKSLKKQQRFAIKSKSFVKSWRKLRISGKQNKEKKILKLSSRILPLLFLIGLGYQWIH